MKLDKREAQLREKYQEFQRQYEDYWVAAINPMGFTDWLIARIEKLTQAQQRIAALEAQVAELQAQIQRIKPAPRFKVGDRVTSRNHPRYPNGQIGTIKQIDFTDLEDIEPTYPLYWFEEGWSAWDNEVEGK